MSDTESTKQVLLVDRDDAFAKVLQQVLGTEYALRHIAKAENAIGELNRNDTDIVLLNFGSQDDASSLQEAHSFLRMASERAAAPPVIAYGWDHQRQSAIEAFRHGVVDFL